MASPIVSLKITSSKSEFASERRFDKSEMIEKLKGKLELITGVVCSFMELELYDCDNKLIATSLSDDKMLGYYSPLDNYRLHVIDKNPQSSVGEFDDLSKVEKYEMSMEEYEKKTDSVRSFMKRNKLGKFSEEAKLEEEKQKDKEENEEKLGKTFKLNDRCQTMVPNQPVRRGVIMFLGEVEFQPGYWVGVKYDEPVGKNDGSVKGKRYFTCDKNYGGFVRPSQVEVGDFPEEELNFSDDDEM